MSKFFGVPDNYGRWLAHQAKQDERLESLPKCHKCSEPIQDDIIVKIHGKETCKDCAEHYYGIEITDNY